MPFMLHIHPDMFWHLVTAGEMLLLLLHGVQRAVAYITAVVTVPLLAPVQSIEQIISSTLRVLGYSFLVGLIIYLLHRFCRCPVARA